MGLFSSAKNKHVSTIAQCSIPAYVIKHLGLRHFLVAGGGGAAKTGVKNEIQLFLLTYNQFSALASQNDVPELRARLTETIDTGSSCNSNSDVLELDQNGVFLLAFGQDENCAIYKTNGYHLKGEEDEVESPSRLTLNLQPVQRINTDQAENGYQKTVRFDRSGLKPLRLATGGIDGHVRIWNVNDLVDNGEPDSQISLLNEFHLNGSEVNDLDFSFCGTTLATITNKEALFWDIDKGTSLVLPTPEKVGSNFKVRSIRFTTLGRKNIVFAAAYQQRQSTSKQNSYISLWSFNRERGTFNMVNLYQIQKDAISTMSVSPGDSAFIACGGMEGNLYCFETENLQCVYMASKCHNSFVTSVDFLPNREVLRNINDPRVPPIALPGPGCDAMISLISLSVDQTVKLHTVPFPKGPSISEQMLKLGLQLMLLYVLLYFLFIY